MSYSIAKYYAETKISHEKNDTKKKKTNKRLHEFKCILVRGNTSRYLLVQSQQWKHQNNV